MVAKKNGDSKLKNSLYFTFSHSFIGFFPVLTFVSGRFFAVD